MALNLKDALQVFFNGLPPSPPPETVEVEKVILVEGKPLDLYRAVDVVHQASHAGGLAGAGWTGDQEQALRPHGQPQQRLRDAQLLGIGNPMRNADTGMSISVKELSPSPIVTPASIPSSSGRGAS